MPMLAGITINFPVLFSLSILSRRNAALFCVPFPPFARKGEAKPSYQLATRAQWPFTDL